MYDVTYHINGKYLPQRDSLCNNIMDILGESINSRHYSAAIAQMIGDHIHHVIITDDMAVVH